MASAKCGGSQAFSRGPSLQQPRPQDTWLSPRSTQNKSITQKPAADLRSQDCSSENTTFKVKSWPLSVFSASRYCYLVYSSTFLCTSIIILFSLFSTNQCFAFHIYTLHRTIPCPFPVVLKQNCPAPFFKLQRPGPWDPRDSSCVTHTRHSTEVTQDGPCVIGEDGEVPSMPAEERRGMSQTRREGHHLAPRTCIRDSNFTLKMVLIFLLGIRCRECWCPLCRSALPRGSPSLLLASSTLAVRKRKGTVTTSTVPEPQSTV